MMMIMKDLVNVYLKEQVRVEVKNLIDQINHASNIVNITVSSKIIFWV